MAFAILPIQNPARAADHLLAAGHHRSVAGPDDKARQQQEQGAERQGHAAQLKRWRYSIPTALHPDPFLKAGDLPPLYFGGDAFGGPRIEGAALSGMAIGKEFLSNQL